MKQILKLKSSEVITIFKVFNLVFASHTAQKKKFFVEDFFSKCDQTEEIFTEEITEKILNEKLYLLCSAHHVCFS